MEILAAIISALWLGVLTSISPCPLATNLAAVAFLSNNQGRPGRAIVGGVLYSAGRVVAYVGLALLLLQSIFSVPQASQFLQKYMNQILGPLLILAGVLLLELLPLSFGGIGFSGRTQEKFKKMGLTAAPLMGVLFALSFCPGSAAIYFGSLLPLATKWQSAWLLPGIYGIGTALPVLVFAIMLARGAGSLGKIINRTQMIGKWAKLLTGVLFIMVGVYYCVVYIYRA